MGKVFFALRTEIDKEWVFADGSYVRCHQHSSGARRGESRATGKSRGGTTTKIHIAVDSHGNPIDFEITGGEVHDSQIAEQLIDMVGDAQYFIADKGYDAKYIRDKAKQHNMTPVIPRRKNSKQANTDFDRYLYRLRHLVENVFARLKQNTFVALPLDLKNLRVISRPRRT